MATKEILVTLVTCCPITIYSISMLCINFIIHLQAEPKDNIYDN